MLSVQQACAIAETATLASHYVGTMSLSKLEQRDGKLIWLIGSATIGSGVTVTIDDATSRVMHCEQWGTIQGHNQNRMLRY